MSSPPPLDFPTSDDVPMGDATGEQTMPDAPPLFLAGTPSIAGTPARHSRYGAPDSTPLRGITARRAVGLSTPKNTPLFTSESRRKHH